MSKYRTVRRGMGGGARERLLRSGFALCLAGACAVAAGAEICDDCADDDGDGLVDCYDPDCGADPVACGAMFLDRVLPAPDCAPALRLRELWRATGQETSIALVGEVDGDAMPEVVFESLSTIYVLDGATGSIERASPRMNFNGHPAIGDVDEDGTAEIFVERFEGAQSQFSLLRFEHDLSLTYALPVNMTSVEDQTGMSLADFDSDGVPEVYRLGVILDPRDGRVLVDLGDLLDGRDTVSSIAADVFPDGTCGACEGLELVGSSAVWAVDPASGGFELMGSYAGGTVRGTHSVVDWNGDGRLDVVTNSLPGADNSGQGFFAWDPTSGALLSPILTGVGLASKSVPAVADFDGDGELEVAIQVMVL